MTPDQTDSVTLLRRVITAYDARRGAQRDHPADPALLDSAEKALADAVEDARRALDELQRWRRERSARARAPTGRKA